MSKRGRQPILNTEEEVITYYTKEYYKRVGENPEVRYDPETHIALIEEVDKEYREYLQKKLNFDQATYLPLFIENIDFITKVFTKKKDKEENDRRKREYFQTLLKK